MLDKNSFGKYLNIVTLKKEDIVSEDERNLLTQLDFESLVE